MGFEQDEDGSYEISEEQHVEFLERLQHLLQDTVDLTWEPLSIQEISDTQLSMKELEAISFLFHDIDEMSEQSITQTA